MTFTRQEIILLVSDAYHHLYDMVYLRTQPLAHLIASTSIQDPKENAWQLHNLLIETIQEINPGPQAPVNSIEWRRFRIMELRFIDGMEPQAVAEQLFISRRHFYRELSIAEEACANLLIERIEALPGKPVHLDGSNPLIPSTQDESSDHFPNADRLELVRQEAARFQHEMNDTNVNDTIQTVTALFGSIASQRGISLVSRLAGSLPATRIDRSILRQILLGLINFPLSLIGTQEVILTSAVTGGTIRITFVIRSSIDLNHLQDRITNELAVTQELASLNGVGLYWSPDTEGTEQLHQLEFGLSLPVACQTTILIGDDNPDIRRLICSMLSARYQVIEAETGAQIIQLAEEFQPQAILLDLMMPDRDGWDALQRLKNSESTRHIPVIVCSVLDMKDLALSLGAIGYINKPVAAAELLALIDSLDC
jgi:CheY-like chemotaxis protein